jgi:hypothetical protein
MSRTSIKNVNEQQYKYDFSVKAQRKATIVWQNLKHNINAPFRTIN